MDCKHIYEKKAILHYIKSKHGRAQCPVAGIQVIVSILTNEILCTSCISYHLSLLSLLAPACPKILQAERVVCDALLQIEIDEMKSMSKQPGRTDVIEDFTELDDDDDDEEEEEDD